MSEEKRSKFVKSINSRVTFKKIASGIMLSPYLKKIFSSSMDLILKTG